MDLAAFMRSCRGLSHLAAGGGTSVYVELAEHDRQALFLVCIGPAPLKTAEDLLGVLAIYLEGGTRIESLCPLCICGLGEVEEALSCGRCAFLARKADGGLSIVHWYIRCFVGHEVTRREELTFPVRASEKALPTQQKVVNKEMGFQVAQQVERPMAEEEKQDRLEEYVSHCGGRWRGRGYEVTWRRNTAATLLVVSMRCWWVSRMLLREDKSSWRLAKMYARCRWLYGRHLAPDWSTVSYC